MKLAPYLLRGLIDVLVLLPFFASILALLTLWVVLIPRNAMLGYPLMIGTSFLLLKVSQSTGRTLIQKALVKRPCLAEPSSGFICRYQPVLLAAFYTITVSLIAIYQTPPSDKILFKNFADAFSLTHPFSSWALDILYHRSFPSPWPYVMIPALIYGSYGVGMASQLHKAGAGPTALPVRVCLAVGMALSIGLFSTRVHSLREGVLYGKFEPPFVETWIFEKYHPFRLDNHLAKCPDPGLQIASTHPRLAGATATYPIYAAAARAIYTGEADLATLVEPTKTVDAYEKLIAGKVDVIFAAEPSTQQMAEAAAAGRQLQLTPIARDAFVFFTHADNPVAGLTTEQIRSIYGKKNHNWVEVGGDNRKIVAFQRPPGSSGQTAFERVVMRDAPIAPALREDINPGRGDLFQRVATYRNSPGALGYSFRNVRTNMETIERVKLLKVDGIAPTQESARSGTYPYMVDFYAITAGSRNPQVEKLVNWFKTPVAQKLVRDAGYFEVSPPAAGE